MEFSNFFDKIDSQESYAFLFISIIVFLFGLIIGLLLRSGKVRRLKKELKVIKKKLADTEIELDLHKEQLLKKEDELATAQVEMRELVSKMEVLDTDRAKLYNDIHTLNAEIEQFQNTEQEYGSSVEDLHNQVIVLKDENEELITNFEAVQEKNIRLQADLEEAQSNPVNNSAELVNNRLGLFEAKLDKLTAENALLKAEMKNVQGAQTSALQQTSFVVTEEPILVGSTEKLVVKKKINTTSAKDNLELIEGVGPFIEKQLNDAGIFTFEQISQFDTETIARITREIGYFPGRIEKDDWVGQAKKLMKSTSKLVKGKKKKSTYPTSDQDLKIIEGIGPKIESILKAEGITNWTELAAASKKRIRTILDAAGNRYKMHDPETWGKQANLAANDKWDELKKLQDELDGGRK